ATFAEGRDRAQGGSFDVIILDVRLPGGTGLELCGELRRGGSSTPVLMLTALDPLDDPLRVVEVGAADYLPKPLACRDLLGRRPVSDGPAADVQTCRQVTRRCGGRPRTGGTHP